MKKFFVISYNCLSEFFDKHFVALTIIIGTSFLFLGLYFGNDKDWGCKLLYTIGSISLTSGIFAGIAKSNQFTEIYKKILREIIYVEEHLEKRKDLENIWDNVTQTLSNQKFQNISDKMKKNIKKYFLPLDHDYYYNDFTVNIDIDFVENNPDYITVKEVTNCTIICDDENLIINNKFKGFIKFDITNRELSKNTDTKLFIDGVEQKVKDIDLKHTIEGNKMVVSYQKDLTGKKSYVVKRVDFKTYNLKFNPIKSQKAAWIYNNCSIDITYPLDLSIDILGLGLLDDFKIDDLRNARTKRLKAEYKGLMYKNQGFFIHYRKK